MMMVSDFAAVLGTLAILILYSSDSLQIWHFYVINMVIGLGTTFQWPAYSAVISTVVPKEQYGRANALLSLVDSGPNIVAPMLAGALLPFMGLRGILIIDVLSFILAISVLLFVHIPQPPRTVEGEAGRGNIFREAAYGFEYIFQRRSLLYLQILMLAGNIFIGIPNSLTAPMVLSVSYTHLRAHET